MQIICDEMISNSDSEKNESTSWTFFKYPKKNSN